MAFIMTLRIGNDAVGTLTSRRFKPLPDMLILGSSNSVAYKDMMSKV